MDWVFTRFAFDGSEIIGSLSPFYFDIYTLELFLCLAKGATLVIVPEQSAIFPGTLLEFIAAQAISFVFWVPTIMVNIANQQLLSRWPLPQLRRVFFAGEVFPTKSLNYWRRHLPEAIFVNLYGPIEISVDCTYFVVDRDMADGERLPIGRPCRNSDILILDEQDRPAQGDQLGELCVRGSSLALGYWNNPERTAEVFVQNPLNPHYPELIYRTGDIVYRNERGEIMIVGRKDFQVKHLGYRIDLGEVEHAALQVGGIRNACVTYNQDKKEIVLFFESAHELSAANIREQLSAYLPKYMLPTVLKRIDQLPRNPNGKIDRQLLAGRCADSRVG
jgi:non-ribosomal peptide synthetase component F